MIASIQGKVAAMDVDHVVIVAGGIGYKVFAPISALGCEIGSDLMLHTTFIVREDNMALFGFTTLAERDIFERLITVSGIGPKIGIAILSTLTIEHLRNAVAAGKPELLRRVPGIGQKTAEKIIFELKDKLKGVSGIIPQGALQDSTLDVIEALTALGYSLAEAQAAVSALPPTAPQDFEGRMRAALLYFINS